MSTWNLDLMRAGVIPDPHYGTHELDVQWVGECDWVYAAVFTLEEDGLTCGVLDFCAPGLDTFCTVRLNG